MPIAPHSPYLAVAALATFTGVVSTQSPRFYRDDPIAREPESQDASKAQPHEVGSLYELTYNLFVTSGYKPSGVRARNINTIDEVPDSSWFTNRIGTTTVTAEELVRGPNLGAPPDPSKWVLIREKTVGRPPGLHREGREGRDLVPRVRSSAIPGRCNRRRRRSRRRSSGRWATTRWKHT